MLDYIFRQVRKCREKKKRINICSREKARLQGCARWQDAIAGRSLAAPLTSASPRGFFILKVLPLGFLRADWRLEKLEPTIRPYLVIKFPGSVPWELPVDFSSFASHHDFPFVFPSFICPFLSLSLSHVLTDLTIRTSSPAAFHWSSVCLGVEFRLRDRFHESRTNDFSIHDLETIYLTRSVCCEKSLSRLCNRIKP